MKKIFLFLLALVASAGTVFAQSSGTCGKDGDNLTWTLSGGTLTISGTGDMADWKSYPDIPWYSNRSSIKSVVIEDGVTSIGESAFAYCTNLTSVSLPNSVTSMGWCAFTDCTALTSFTISKSVTNITGGAFLGCTGLTSIIVESGNTTYDSRDNCNAIIETATNTLIQGCKNTIIPYSVTSIGSNAFREYTTLTSIDIPYSVTSIGYGAFENCSGLTSITCGATEPPTCGGNCFYGVDKSIPVYVPKGKVADYKAADGWKDFGDNIQEITPLASGTCGKEGDGSNLTWTLSKNGVLTISGTGDMADWSNTNPWYENRSSIKSVVIEAGVTSIGKYAFYNCDNLTSVTIPGSVTSIGNYAFNKCSSLASVTIPEGVISIGQRAFWNCTSLTSIALPEGIKSIGVRTFCQCTSLKSVTIPASVTNIYDEAFSGCNALTEITCKATIPPTCGGGNCFYDVTKSIPVYVPNVDAYTAASVWSSFTNFQSLYVAYGTCGAEGDGSNLTWTLSKEGVLTISGTGAMADWYSDDYTPWKDYKYSIKSVEIVNGVTNIGESSFRNCGELTSVAIPNSIKSIGDGSFNYCNNLTSIEIPNSVTSIGFAFYACNLISVTIPNSVTSIATGAFAANSFTSIIVESENTKYDSRGNCNAIIETATNTLITGCINTVIPKDIKIIANFAFASCPMTSIEIPNGVTSIGNNAFSFCWLNSVTIPASVTNIGDYAFDYCSALTSITCEATTPPTCGEDCFYNVPKTIPLYVPEGKVADYKAADGWKDFGENIQEIPPLASGTCGKEGDNLKWTLSKEGVLTISGTGEMADYNYDDPSWQPYLSSINTVKIEEGVTSIGTAAFYKCTGLTSVTIPNSVISIGYQAFRDCDGLTSVTIGSGLANLGKAFTYASLALASITVDPENANFCDVDGVLFNKDKTELILFPVKKSATTYAIPSSVISIGDFAFWACKLTSVEIPNSVKSIGEEAFSNAKMTSLMLGNGIESLGKEAFAHCWYVESITCSATTPPTCGTDCFHGIEKTIPLYVPKGTILAYGEADIWKEFTNMQELEGTAIDQISQEPTAKSQKLIKNGQLFIEQNGKVYTVTGQEVR